MSDAADAFGFDDVQEFHKSRSAALKKKAGFNRRNEESDEDSEVEVMGLSDEDDSEEEDHRQKKFGFEKKVDSEDEEYFKTKDDDDVSIEGDEDDENWGAHKNDYYGGDEIDEEDPEVQKAMEEEALRQQKKHLAELSMDDYMDEDMLEEWQKTKDTAKDTKSILLHDVPKQDIASLEPEERLKLLKSSFPEFIPLSKELSSLKPILDSLRKQQNENELYKAKFTSLSAYLGAISSYFAIFLSNLESESSNFTMSGHPVIEAILTARECWRQASELPDEVDMINAEEDMSSGSEEDLKSMLNSVSSDSEEDDYESEEEQDNKTHGAEKDGDLNIDINVKRKIKRLAKKREDEIDDVDAEEKKNRRRTLRFYTSKIDQAENKKDARYAGDEDLPYKERLFERQQRLLEEARKRGQKASGPGVDLDDNDMNSDEERYANEINNAEDDDYYNSLQSSKAEHKANRMSAHKEAAKAAKEGRLAELEEAIGGDGKRAINYQIMKNKGLTPHRKKDNRNSRVKKRKKYEKAQKKLKSVRAVYSGQQGPYSGEKTGIKKGLSKSVSLV